MRKIIALLIGLCPFNVMRIFLYRTLLGYKITYTSKIGWFNLINCHECEIGNGGGGGGAIGMLNRIQCHKLYMENGSSIKNGNTIGSLNNFFMKENSGIGSYNKFIGSYKDLFPYKEFSNFTLGSKSLVTYHHWFNVTDSITIGENVVFGGIHTQVWTHGFDTHRIMIQSPITIGNDIYIGSGVIISQGVSIMHNSIIGAGTVISKSINESGFYISNQLIRKSDIQSYSNIEDTVTYGDYKFYRKINTNEK